MQRDSTMVVGSMLLVGVAAVFFPRLGLALGPGEICVVVNRNVPASQAVADHYCAKRGVPAENVVTLELPEGEDISRRDFDERLANPLRAALESRRDAIKVLLTVYGVPLRVGPQEPNAEQQAELAELAEKRAAAQNSLEMLKKEIAILEQKQQDAPSDEQAARLEALQKQATEFQAELTLIEQRQGALSFPESLAAVDSELALLWWPAYELRRWQINPLYFGVPDDARGKVPPLVLVSRLDGPTPELAMRLVDQALQAEEQGLTGRVYVDARGIGYDPAQDGGFGYGGYDESLREMARLLEKSAGMEVTLDDKPELFASGSCADCALYCGWYSLANYVDCCRFAPGAVAYHIASSEAVSLRDPNGKYWCKNLLEQGAVATLGPVAEPYTVGFPKPAEFFGFLATGRHTLVESYWRTALFASWMTVLVGDPLYNPYARSPRLKPEDVKASPAGMIFPFRPGR